MINNKKILAVTLARGGSKSIPKKNIATIDGLPLIAYTIQEALKSKYIDEYIVSTDDKEIADISKIYGAAVPFIRPSSLSEDSSSSADALIHAVNFMKNKGKNFDYIVELMATNPLKISIDIDSCIEKLDTEQCNFVVAVKRVQDGHPSRLKYIEQGILKDFYPEIPESRRQDLTPDAYIRCGSIYAMRCHALLEGNARYGEGTHAYIMEDKRVVNIDEPIDLEVARTMLTKR